MADANQFFRIQKFRFLPERRPRVPIHPNCPACGSLVAVRRVDYTLWPFWRCFTWPKCRWTSWRPRHPRDCPACGGPRFWSYSRKSIGCPSCGRRFKLSFGQGNEKIGE
jgi:ssDNA-binding Zn-finger/Zn-ribbon topoisomerase 1